MALVPSSRLVSVVVAVALGLVPLAPAEHVHEVEENGHQHLLVHRHSEEHHGSHHSREHQGVLDENETPVLTLTAAYVMPGAAPTLAAPPVTAFITIEPPAAKRFLPIPAYVERLIHGPPRAPVPPRAPPSALAS